MWKDIPNWPYKISSNGEVCRKDRWPDGPYLKTCPNPNGYVIVNLSNSGYQKSYNVHRLVAEAFYGPCPDGYFVFHLDLDLMNNQLPNLRYMTRLEAVDYADRNGLIYPKPATNHHSILNEEDVVEICRLASGGMHYKEIAKRYPVTDKCIHSILSRKNWIHVSKGLLSEYRPPKAPCGSKTGMSKLTEAQVIQMRQDAADGRSLTDIAAESPVTLSAVVRIVNRERWKHI